MKGAAVATLVAGALAVAALDPQVHAAVVRPVLEDTWIDGLSSTTPHGNDLALGICPVAHYWIYLKFDVGGLPGSVTAAELRMTRIDGSRPEEISLYRIDQDGWSEATLTAVTRPAPTNPAAATTLGVGQVASGYDRWASPALTSAVAQEALGDGTLSLMLREDPVNMFDIRHYRSSEAAVPDVARPRLVLTLALAEVQQLQLGEQLTWAAAGAGVRYDVVAGTLSDLRRDGGVSAASCLADDLVATSLDVADGDPLPGDGRYYLVRSQYAELSGTYGFASSGAERVPVGGCP